MKNILKTAVCYDIEELVVTSPIGNLILKHCQNGLHSISQTTPPTNLNKLPENERFGIAVTTSPFFYCCILLMIFHFKTFGIYQYFHFEISWKFFNHL